MGEKVVNFPAWSYSSLKAFKTCPKQYYEVRVAKNYSFPEETEATRYGTEFHTAAELYVRDDVPLPLHFTYAKPYLDTLKNLPGRRYCEYKMGLTKALQPCDFYYPDVWCRGVVDLLVVNEDTGVARVLDYKTGKSTKYADTAQLELMALMVFKHFPKIKKVKGGLLFVVANDFKKDTYDVIEEHTYWRNWMMDVARLENAHRTGVWNPIKSGLCRKHCPVTSCPHNGANE
jgi:RecB family exonuclease